MDHPGPEAVTEALVRFLGDGNVDAVVDLYEAEAVFIELEGVSTGRDAIRAAHQRFLDAGLVLTLKNSAVFQANDLALVHWSWTVHDDAGFSSEGVSAEVLRLQPDGKWKFVIDNSDGPAMIGTAHDER